MPHCLHIQIPIQVFSSEEELSPSEQTLWARAKEASNKSYSPYSNYCVGAAILLKNGEVIEGTNQENAAYPSGLCAERVALFSCGVLFPTESIELIAIVARKANSIHFVPAAPCGGCRQVMCEFEHKQASPIQVLFQGEMGKIYKLEKVSDLMPIGFGAENLYPD